MKTRIISWAVALVVGAGLRRHSAGREARRHERGRAPRRRPPRAGAGPAEREALRPGRVSREPARSSGRSRRRRRVPGFDLQPDGGLPARGRQAPRARARARAGRRRARALRGGRVPRVPRRRRAPLVRCSGRSRQIEDVPRGVRVTFAPGARVDAIVEHMRCQYAYARAHAFDARVTCPLYMPGISIRRAGALGVDIRRRTRRTSRSFGREAAKRPLRQARSEVRASP